MSSADRKKAGSPRSARRSRALILLVAVVLLAYYVYAGLCLANADGQVSNRYRMHAIPVALSVLYYDKAHDLTAYRKIAFEFQGSALSTVDLVEKYRHGAERDVVRASGDYLWVADDRGAGDFVALAFLLFGAQLSSLYWLYCVMLAATVAAYCIGLRRDGLSILLLPLMLGGYVVTLFSAPLNGTGPITHEPWIPIHDSRSFDAFGIIGLAHILLVAIGRIRMSRSAILALAAQTLLLAFLLLSRSSLKLGIVCVLVAGLVFAVRAWLALRNQGLEPSHGQGGLWRAFARAPAVAAVAAAICVPLLAAAYQASVYHPAYFKSERTVWHNILMGVGSQEFGDFPRSLADDRAAVVMVVQTRNREKPDQPWDADTILNSLGGHVAFDWRSYEALARRLVIDNWLSRPGAMLKWYFYDKPSLALAELRDAARRDFARQSKDYGAVCWGACEAQLTLLHWPVLALLAIVSVIARAVLLRYWLPAFVAISAGAIVYLLPSTIFYVFLLNLAGSITLGAMAAYWVFMMGIAAISERIRPSAPQRLETT